MASNFDIKRPLLFWLPGLKQSKKILPVQGRLSKTCCLTILIIFFIYLLPINQMGLDNMKRNAFFIFLSASWYRKIISSKGRGDRGKQLHIYIRVIIWSGVQVAWRKWKVCFEILLGLKSLRPSLIPVCCNQPHSNGLSLCIGLMHVRCIS